jgi:hypothetical protein
VHLGFDPGGTCLDLLGLGRLVDPPLPARHPLEVLDHVRDVGVAPLDPGLVQRLVEDGAGGPDERLALPVLAIPGLLADQHGARALQSLAEDGLRRTLPQGTSPALLDRRAQLRKGRPLRDERLGSGGLGAVKR